MDSSVPSAFRAGLAVLLGRTNVGKSTLLNALVEAKISIVSARPQTTRHPIHGVVHRPHGQVVFVDTPGFFRTHKSQMVDSLHGRARAALKEVDVIVHVVDPSRAPGAEDDMVIEALSAASQPRILCLSKADLRRRPFRDAWLARAKEYAFVDEVSGRTREGIPTLVEHLIGLLPPGMPLYPPEEITNANRDFRVAEIVREKVYLLTGQEVPYRTAVRFDETFEEERPDGDPLLHVRATILVAHDRYKAMLIGARGRMIRDIGTAARPEIEKLFGRKLYLELSVKVDAHFPT